MFGLTTPALSGGIAKLISALAGSINLIPEPVSWRSRGKGRGHGNGLPALHRSISRQSNPAGPRKWHDPASREQGFRMLAADAKRQRRAEKLSRDAHRSWDNNYAWDPRPSLNPMYVNRG